jgi:hypothetical protein
MLRTQEPVEVWTGDGGEPLRLVWRARRFRVNDTPTPLVAPCDWWEPFADSGAPGGPPLEITGWRFQAVASDGEAHVFDVAHDGAHWQLLRVFD